MKKIISISASLVILLLIIGSIYYLNTGNYDASELALEAMKSDDTLTILDDSYISFLPKDSKTTAVIYYPGGKVDPKAYAVFAKELSLKGYPVFISKMPFNLAVLGINKGNMIINNHPEINNWVVAGHSLGGVMVAEYALKQEKIEGLILYGSYVQDKPEFKNTNLKILSIGGSRDNIVPVEQVQEGVNLLPNDTQLVIIEGSNHSQFSSYGSQKGDFSPEISDQEALNLIIENTLLFLQSFEDE